MTRFSIHRSLVFLLLVAAAVVLKPLMARAGLELVAQSSLTVKASPITWGTPARAAGAHYRVDKMERDSVTGAFLKTETRPARADLAFAPSTVPPGRPLPLRTAPRVLRL
ncbi:MAG TPA: hypothetical protein VFR02_07770 [bacterium]|nr:hypothetical protein [bacterium]